MSHFVFEVIPENPQKQHIPSQMHPSPVQEHGRDQGRVILSVGQPDGEQGVVIIEQRQSTVCLEQGQTAEEHGDIQRNQREGHIRRASGRVVVADGKHAATVPDVARAVKWSLDPPPLPEVPRCRPLRWCRHRRDVRAAHVQRPAWP